jgi:hypothetical protein
MLQKDVDENPFPNVAEKPRLFLLWVSVNGFLAVSIWVKTSTSERKLSPSGQSISSLKSGYVE